MMRSLRLRTRLTVFVTLAFTLATTLVSVLALTLVQQELTDDARAGAEAVLTDYLELTYGGSAGVGVVDGSTTTQFFYRDDTGREIGEREYALLLSEALDTEFDDLIVGDVVDGGEAPQPTDPADDVNDSSIAIIDADGQLIDADGTTVSFTVGPQPVGQPRAIDSDPGTVGIVQSLEFADGTRFEVGVTAPLRPVTDSINLLRRLLWFALPALIAVVAAITWLAAGRSLSPVHAMSARARAITGGLPDQRVPVPVADDEIRELATTINDMLSRIDASQRRQRQLAADASHELRSPVAASLTQLEVALRSPQPDWTRTAEVVVTELEHLRHMLDDLLALSRLDEAGVRDDVVLDLDELVLAEAARPRPVPVRTVISAPVRLTADTGLIDSALRNLIDNAARHAHTEVVVTLEHVDGSAIVHIDDDGPGVPEADRERIFDRFTRLDESRTRTAGGAGLGLAIVHDVVAAHGGTVDCTASPTGGARFTVSIPIEVGLT